MHESYIRYSAEEKETIVLSVKRSELSIVQALKRLGTPRRTFYNWYQKYATGGVNALRETPYRRQTVRCQIKVHNCKCSYLCCNIILLFSEILLLIEFCFIVSLIFLIFSPCPKYTSLGVRLSNDS